jgi:hypothetical protein
MDFPQGPVNATMHDGGHILDVLDESSIEANMGAIKGRNQII